MLCSLTDPSIRCGIFITVLTFGNQSFPFFLLWYNSCRLGSALYFLTRTPNPACYLFVLVSLLHVTGWGGSKRTSRPGSKFALYFPESYFRNTCYYFLLKSGCFVQGPRGPMGLPGPVGPTGEKVTKMTKPIQYTLSCLQSSYFAHVYIMTVWKVQIQYLKFRTRPLSHVLLN